MALRSTALALAVGVVLLSACTDEDSPSSAPETDQPSVTAPSTTEATTEPTTGLTTELVSEAAEAEAAVAGFYDEFAAGELDAACAWWTEDYATLSVDNWNTSDYGPAVDSCPGLLTEITKVLAIVGDPAAQLEVTDLRGELTNSDSARVDVTLASAEEPETYLLTLTDAGWRISGDRAGRLAPKQG